MADIRLLRAFCAILAVLNSGLYGIEAAKQQQHHVCPKGFANFGDSSTDTGNALAAFPFLGDAENSPYGDTFFGSPAKRFSDGRLVPDFFSLAFGIPLLDGYFATATFDYRYGVNFAVAGATASPSPLAVTPFALPVQVNQFIRFVNSVKSTKSARLGCANLLPVLPPADAFSGWLYTVKTGGNDVLTALLNGTAPTEIVSTVIPASVKSIAAAVRTLYGQSARKFLIFSVAAQGCSTSVLTLFGSLPRDSLGCVASVNQLIQGFNQAVLTAIQALRVALPDATIAYFDYYNANVEILQNPETYGIHPSKTKTACCGAPGIGSLNYNPAVTCGHPANGSNVCANPSEYINWDGIHFTEQVYRAISRFALSGRFTDHGTNYTALCNLDFSKFGTQVTCQQVYGLQCNKLFS